jgi:hydroxymethylpyrimidine/phosphomethylpyrimidine kinase
MARRPPRLLTIAGSDSGGGAGIQADLKTFAAHGGYGMSVITAVTAQNTVGVTAVHQVPPAVIRAQLAAVLEDIGVDAIKVGMLGDAAAVEAVADGLAGVTAPIVVDPVMVAKSGDALLAPEAVAAVADLLLPLATLVTPNLPEAARLAGMAVDDEPSRLAAAHRLAGRGCSVLLKGGHGEGEEVVDLLVVAGGGTQRFTHPRLRTRATHGTGCTLSSAIAARLGSGEALPDAVAGGIEYLQVAMRAAYPLGEGHGPVNHAVPPPLLPSARGGR